MHFVVIHPTQDRHRISSKITYHQWSATHKSYKSAWVSLMFQIDWAMNQATKKIEQLRSRRFFSRWHLLCPFGRSLFGRRRLTLWGNMVLSPQRQNRQNPWLRPSKCQKKGTSCQRSEHVSYDIRIDNGLTIKISENIRKKTSKTSDGQKQTRTRWEQWQSIWGCGLFVFLTKIHCETCWKKHVETHSAKSTTCTSPPGIKNKLVSSKINSDKPQLTLWVSSNCRNQSDSGYPRKYKLWLSIRMIRVSKFQAMAFWLFLLFLQANLTTHTSQKKSPATNIWIRLKVGDP